MIAVEFLPSWVFHLTVLTGLLAVIVSFVLNFIPFVTAYKISIQIIGIVLVVIGMWFEGGLSNNAQWKSRITEMQLKVAASEKLAEAANAKIEYVYVDKIKIVKEVRVVIKNRIREVATVIDAECKVPPVAIRILNDSARNVKPGPVK